MKRIDFLKLFESGNPVYLKHEIEDCVLRYEPKSGKFYVKFKDEPEFKAHDNSTIVSEAMLEQKVISESEYQEY